MPEAISRYGVIASEPQAFHGSTDRLYRLPDMVEKPPAGQALNLAIIGRYVLTPGIFQALAETAPGQLGEIQLTDGIRHLLDREPVYAYRFEGSRYDAGDRLSSSGHGGLALRRESGRRFPQLPEVASDLAAWS